MPSASGTTNSLNRNAGKPSEWTIRGTDITNTTDIWVFYPRAARDEASATYAWKGNPHHVKQPGGTAAAVFLKCTKRPHPVKEDLDTTDTVCLIVGGSVTYIEDVTMYDE